MNADPLYARARNVAIDGVPDWIELIPAGPTVTGADGRSWVFDDPAALLAAFQRRNAPLVVDWEHASETRAPNGLDAPAAGWIDRIENRGGALWGHVEWTEKAAQQIAAKEYRFLSPVFIYEKTGRRIVALTSAGLTNQPNLSLTALNREESPMALPNSNELYMALGLPVGSDEAVVLDSIRALHAELNAAQNRAATPPLDKFVPRADYDAALARASNAETRVAAIEAERRQAKIDGLIESALKDGKIVPATKDYYVAMCQTENGIEAFEAFLAKAPPVLGAPSGLADKPAPTASALNRAAFDAKTPSERRAFLVAGGRVTD